MQETSARIDLGKSCYFLSALGWKIQELEYTSQNHAFNNYEGPIKQGSIKKQSQ